MTGLGTVWRTRAGATCSSSSSRCCVSAMPTKSAAPERSSASASGLEGPDARRRVFGSRKSSTRAGTSNSEITIWCAGKLSVAANTGQGEGHTEVGEERSRMRWLVANTPERQYVLSARVVFEQRGEVYAHVDRPRDDQRRNDRPASRPRGLTALAVRKAALVRRETKVFACAVLAAARKTNPMRRNGTMGMPGTAAETQTKIRRPASALGIPKSCRDEFAPKRGVRAPRWRHA